MEYRIKKILNGMDCTDRQTIGMIYDTFKEDGIKVHYSEGATKGCFIFENFVIKFKLDDSDSRNYDDCVARELFIYNKAKEWTLLLQLGTIGSGDFEWMFGDCGMLYYYIKKEDLAAKKFDNIWFALQCC
jgi:hypothetical protein